MDEDVRKLLQEERRLEAAALAKQRGDHETACVLFEQACDFGRAAEEAAAATKWDRALVLAVDGNHAEVRAAALDELRRRPTDALRVAYVLEGRGDLTLAGQLFLAAEKRPEAARAFERGGDAVRAADALEAHGDVKGAARVLEARARKAGAGGDVHLRLGQLLQRYGKVEAAVRSLQKVRPGEKERREAVGLLVDAFAKLGLEQAQAEAARELTTLGGPLRTERPKAPPQKSDGVAPKPRLYARYEVVREVASSPSARVLECTDLVRGERVAVKVFAGHHGRGLGRDVLARFEREVRILRSLDHPNVVPMRDYVAEGPAVVLAWMSGGTLKDLLSKTSITPSRAVEITQSVLLALSQAHRAGVVHRDVKPANILFDPSGGARLSDFGVAHFGDLSATATAGIIGTMGYMSPEQREGRPATAQSDLYSAGVVLWEMLTGVRPDPKQTDLRTRRRPSQAHRELGPEHDELLLQLLDPNPEGRPVGAAEAHRALAGLSWPDHADPQAARRPSSRPPPAADEAPRFQPLRPGLELDLWLNRAVRIEPLQGDTLARARAFARADHPCLPQILRVDRAEGTVWIEAPRGPPLEGDLAPPQRLALEEALARLHEAGAVYGPLSRKNVHVDPKTGAARLTFTGAPSAHATLDLDRLALADLGGGARAPSP